MIIAQWQELNYKIYHHVSGFDILTQSFRRMVKLMKKYYQHDLNRLDETKWIHVLEVL